MRAIARPHLTALLVTLMASSAVSNPAPLAAADQTSDIPGIPLPGPVAAGRLGGAVYDVVYRLTVEPGHVIVASVTGTAGTDFDIYLFDTTATTVLSTTGLLVKSTGPTSHESITWPSRFGGTYYIDLNGATDVEGDYFLTVQTIPDPTPPRTSVVLGGGRTATNQLIVPVTLDASDDLSGVVAMALSDDGVTFGEWQSFQPTSNWTFQPGDGVRRLWVKVQNGVGLVSPVATDSITLDTVAPEIVELIPEPGARVASLRPRFSVAFNEPIDPATWLNHGLLVQSAGGSLIAGAFAYDVQSRTGTFTPSSSLVAGALYVVTVGDVRDVAGNRIGDPGSWTVTPLIPTTLAATASPVVLNFGGSSEVELEISGAPLPAVIEAEMSTAANGVVPLAPVSTDDGTNSIVVAPTLNTTFRFRYLGTASVAGSGTEVRVLVRRRIVLVGKDSAVTSRGRVGTAVNLVSAVTPGAPGLGVSFRLYRFDSVRRTWVYAGSKGRRTDITGRASLTWTPASSGTYYWRAYVASTPDMTNNVSPVYRWSISR